MPTDQIELALTPESLVWMQVWFPRPFSDDAAHGLLRYLAALEHQPQIILEARARIERDKPGVTIEHLIGTKLKYSERIKQAIESLVPGSMVVMLGDPKRTPTTVARRVKMSTTTQLLEPVSPLASVKAIRHALTAVTGRETLVLQVILGPRHRPQLPPVEPTRDDQSLMSKVVFGLQPETRTEVKKSVSIKQAQHGFSAVIRIGVSAFGEQRRKSLLLGLASALGTVNTPGVHLRLGGENVKRLNAPRATWPLWPLVGGVNHLAVTEAVRLIGWPVSDKEEAFPGQGSLHPKKVRPTPALLNGSRIIAKANAPGVEGHLSYNVDDAMKHTWVLGPSGTGKSTLLLNLIVGDLEAGRPVVVIEPKDLITDLLSRIPEARKRDIVILDPLDDYPVSINPLDRLQSGTEPEVVADQFFHVFHKLYGESLGRRSGDILRESLKAIALRKDPSLIMLPIILTEKKFRDPLVQKAVDRDPFAAGTFWDWYRGLSPEGIMNNIAPLSNKVRPFLDRYLRGVLAQQHARFNVRQVLEQNKVLLVQLQPGVVGPERAQLMAAMILSELWNSIQERAAIPESQRDDLMIYVDEVQSFLNLPVNLDDALATARSLRAGFHFAHQYESQLPAPMLKAFKNNARNKIAFQLGADDADDMAKGQSVLSKEDFFLQPAHHIYANLVRHNSVQPWTSGETLPPPPKTSDPNEIRQLSREQYGRPRDEIEAEFRELLGRPDVTQEHRSAAHSTPRPRRNQRRRQP